MDTPPPADRKTFLRIRSRILQAIRLFFTERDFIEVETPVCVAAPALEQHIDAQAAGDKYLRTSPELHMKRLLAAGHERIFQVGPCFRKGEQGRMHSPEYTMLEWYRSGADYMDVLVDTRALLVFVFEQAVGGTTFRAGGVDVELLPLWECMTVSEAFLQYAGWDPCRAFDADRFDLDLVGKVEPALPVQRPVVLKDYPAPRAALARCRPGSPPVAERWELYLAGVELANAYSELTDPEEQRCRFRECAGQRGSLGKEVYPPDEAFLAALDAGLPPSGGVALGVDRLVMLACDAGSIDDVRAFPC